MEKTSPQNQIDIIENNQTRQLYSLAYFSIISV